jgi:hypothetical protein
MINQAEFVSSIINYTISTHLVLQIYNSIGGVQYLSFSNFMSRKVAAVIVYCIFFLVFFILKFVGRWICRTKHCIFNTCACLKKIGLIFFNIKKYSYDISFFQRSKKNKIYVIERIACTVRVITHKANKIKYHEMNILYYI